jgi:integrase
LRPALPVQGCSRIELPWLDESTRPTEPVRVPVVLTPQEVDSVLSQMDGVYGLIARLLYGTGMRLTECAQLRIKDVDFQRREIIVRQGKGAKDRVTVLPLSLIAPLRDRGVAY